jgi:RNA polymerase sigma-70 factor (ECF subfamily)
VALSETDRKLLTNCLTRKHKAWEDFVDRFMGLVIHVINHSAQARSIRLSTEDREDLAGDVFLTLVKDDFAVLRHFRGESSLATYLTVVTRRIVVGEMLKHRSASRLTDADAPVADGQFGATERLENREEVERLLEELNGSEAQVVRLYHLEGKSYHEIAAQLGIPENSIGPTLSRARQKMRRVGVDQ